MSSGLIGGEQSVARVLRGALGEAAADRCQPVWAMLVERGEGVDLAVAPDDFEPLGWSAPPDCVAVGVVGTGRVRQLDESAELAANLAAARAGGVSMACVVFRTGTVGWDMVLPDGSTFDQVPEEGRMLDLLRRCLGLPTPPPPTGVGYLTRAAWLGALIEAGSRSRPLSWSSALDLHPALCGRFAGLDGPGKEWLVEALGDPGSWEDLRAAVAAGYVGAGLPDPELAAWMDSGMFARWLMSELRPLEELLAEARPNLRPTAARRLAHMIHSAG